MPKIALETLDIHLDIVYNQDVSRKYLQEFGKDKAMANTGEYGMICIVCLEPATENTKGEWYCKEHVPAPEKQWGGKREGAGRQANQAWFEAKNGWWGSKQYRTQPAAFNAAQKIGMGCTFAKREDGFYHLFCQYNPMIERIGK